jgi:dUTP pyrophosphatase
MFLSQIMASENIAVLQFVKLTESALPPTRGSSRAAAFDLRSAYDVVIPASGNGLVKTDLSIQLPPGCYGRIAPRSGLSLHHHIDVGGGVVDGNYRGNVGVILFNHSNRPFQINRGDRIAQFTCQNIVYPTIREVNELDETERDVRGFGSTGRD